MSDTEHNDMMANLTQTKAETLENLIDTKGVEGYYADYVGKPTVTFAFESAFATLEFAHRQPILSKIIGIPAMIISLLMAVWPLYGIYRAAT
jgi:hypothetical protein